jgi:hypothetical protein
MNPWSQRWSPAEWRQFLLDGESPVDICALRQYTHTGRPLGTPEFVATLEESTARLLAPRKGGRPKKPRTDSHQLALKVPA